MNKAKENQTTRKAPAKKTTPRQTQKKTIKVKDDPKDQLELLPFRNLFFWHIQEVRKLKCPISEEENLLKKSIAGYHLAPLKDVLLSFTHIRPEKLPRLEYVPDNNIFALLRYPTLSNIVIYLICRGESHEQISTLCQQQFSDFDLSDNAIKRFSYLCFSIPHPVSGNPRDILKFAELLKTLGKFDPLYHDYSNIILKKDLSWDMICMIMSVFNPAVVDRSISQVMFFLVLELRQFVQERRKKELEQQIKLIDRLQTIMNKRGIENEALLPSDRLGILYD